MVPPAAAKLEFDAGYVKPVTSSEARLTGRVSGGLGTSDPGRITVGFAMTATLPLATTGEEHCGMLRKLPAMLRNLLAVLAPKASTGFISEFNGLVRLTFRNNIGELAHELGNHICFKLQKVKDITVDVFIIDRADQTPTAN